MGMAGGCRSDELVHMRVEHLEKQGNLIVVHIPKTKTYIKRQFTVDNEFRKYIHKYMALRPADLPDGRLFLNYQKGVCTHQFIGKNKIAEMPKLIATFLKLPEAEMYTGHAVRRTSATFLAEAGINMIDKIIS